MVLFHPICRAPPRRCQRPASCVVCTRRCLRASRAIFPTCSRVALRPLRPHRLPRRLSLPPPIPLRPSCWPTQRTVQTRLLLPPRNQHRRPRQWARVCPPARRRAATCSQWRSRRSRRRLRLPHSPHSGPQQQNEPRVPFQRRRRRRAPKDRTQAKGAKVGLFQAARKMRPMRKIKLDILYYKFYQI